MARLAALTLPAAAALDNSFVLPAMGWSSWYAAPYGSQVTEGFVKASAQALISSGLAAKGYTFVNVDEGWLKGRSAQNGSIYEDLAKFPSGMAALGSWITAQPTTPNGTERMRYGLYSCRGTCQCGTSKYGAVGSHGHEAADTAWMIAAGATWLKIDSCCGSQDHATAFADYAKFRDAMNSSGTPVWFNLCGWRDWYAPPDPALNYSGGQSLGNSYRIYGDGGSWRAISGAINTMAHVGQYAAPGGYPDPDNILGPHGTVGRVSEHQARTQMVLWSLAPTQLILGEDVTRMSAEYVETVGNAELIAINQDAPFAGPMRRVVGTDLAYPCAAATVEAGGEPAACTNVWARPLANGDVALAFLNQGPTNATVICDAACFAAANVSAAREWQVRDLIAHAAVATLRAPLSFSFAVGADGSSAAFRVSPMA